MIKKLSKYIGEYKKASFLSPITVMCEVVLEMIIPLIMANIIDFGVEKGDLSYTLKWGGIMLVCALFSLLFGILCAFYAAKASTGFAKNLRGGVYRRIQEMSFSNVDKFSTAGLITVLTTDITNLQNAYQMIIRMCARSPFMLITALFMVISINPKMSLIFVGAAIFLVIILAFIISHAHPIFIKVFKKYDALNMKVQENVTGIRVVKAYVREDFETKGFKEKTNELKNMFLSAEKFLNFNAPAMQFTVYSCILLISWVGAKFVVVDKTLTTGQLTSLFSYTMNILTSLMMLSMAFVMITMAKASAERIINVLDEESDIVNPQNPVMEVKDGSVVFENVSFSYSNNKEKLNLKDVNIEIKSGETVGIIGSTGSAKSTLVQLIPRLYDVTEGKVTIGGVDVRDYDIKTLRDNVAMVLQKNVLFSGTIKENLRWGNNDATDEEIIEASKLACADEFIEGFPEKYDTFIEQGGANVSGGQKQRLCIARALIKKPKILILDDSTSAVDTGTDMKIRKSFKEYIPETTKIIIAQRISSVEDADKIIVIDNGKINGVGTHRELLETNVIYREVYETQVKGSDK